MVKLIKQRQEALGRRGILKTPWGLIGVFRDATCYGSWSQSAVGQDAGWLVGPSDVDLI